MTPKHWDYIGYALLASFAMYAASDPEFPVFLLVFGFVGFLLWTSFDRTK